MNGRERVLAHLEGIQIDSLPCLPITMMFAARQIGVPYQEYATDYRRLVDGQMRVAEEFDIDYLNTMSDPAIEASDCGACVAYYPDAPPALDEENALLREKRKLIDLAIPDPASAPRMSNRLRAVTLLTERAGRDKLIEGWVEGPCAEAADLRGINTLMMDFYDDPGFVRDLFAFVIEMELAFAKEQVGQGAMQIGIGDAAASLVGPRLYDEFVWPYEKRLVEGIHAMGAFVRLHVCGDTRRIAGRMAQLGCEIVDLDFPVPLDHARREMGEAQIIAGNIDPVRILRNGSPDMITYSLSECHRQAGRRYMVAAGCEVPRDTPDENLRALVQYARAHRPEG